MHRVLMKTGFVLCVLSAAACQKKRKSQAHVASSEVVDLASAFSDSKNPTFNPKADKGAGFHSTQQSAIDGCGHCHPSQAEQWQRSNHSQASRDPLFNWLELKSNLTKNGAFRADGAMPNFCVRCHAPAAAFDGSVTDRERTVIGQLAEKNKVHKPGQEGVTCLACHGQIRDPENEIRKLSSVNFREGVNTMFYSPSSDYVRTGNNHAANGKSPRKKGLNEEIQKISSKKIHEVEAFYDQSNEPYVIGLQNVSGANWLKYFKSFPDFYDSSRDRVGGFGGFAKSDVPRPGMCIYCHNVRVRAGSHSQEAESVFEQETASEWADSQSFNREINCVDCHMSKVFKPEVAQAMSDEMTRTSQVSFPDRLLKTRFPDVGPAAIIPSEFAKRKINRVYHGFVGGYNVPIKNMAIGQVAAPKPEDLVEEKLSMFQTGLSLEPLIKQDSQSCQEVKLGAKVENKSLGHNIPTGLSHIRELWIDTRLYCDGNFIWGSGNVEQPGELLKDVNIDYKTYSEIGQPLSKDSPDFYVPVITGKGPDESLISFNEQFGDKKFGDGGVRILDFINANYFSLKLTGDGFMSRGPISGNIERRTRASFYPQFDFAKMCPTGEVTGKMQLKLRFFAPWVLEDVKRNIAAGLNSETKAGRPVGFPKKALEDVAAGYVEAIDDQTIRDNKIHVIHSTSSFVVKPRQCK